MLGQTNTYYLGICHPICLLQYSHANYAQNPKPT